jgi:adenylate cyclase
MTDNASADTRFQGKSVVMQSVRSAMCTPLMASAEEVLGILYVDSLTATEAFSDEDLQFLIGFSGIVAATLHRLRDSERMRREAVVRSNFERYFAPNVAAQIAQQQEGARPVGEKRPITILFSDIRGFTTMSESMTPDAIAQLLSEYFTEMVEVIFEHGGTLDKFVGDAILALWGAPIAHDDDADGAMRAASDMQRSIEALNAKWAAAGRPTIGVGIGINYGEVFAGNIGSQRRLEYTVIGDAVNVASRLCTQAGAGEILLTEPFYQRLTTSLEVERIDAMPLKGRAQPIAIYRVKR